MQELSREELQREVQELRDRLEVAEETLRAIREGEVDALVVSTPKGDRLFTLEGADYPYRVFVEGMKEGAATITPDGIILYCNSRFAALLKQPLQKVIGTNFQLFLSPLDQQFFQTLSRQADEGVGKGELSLIASDKTNVPVQVAMNRLKLNNDIYCLIVTDLTEQKQNLEIIAAEKLARSILEQAAEAIVVCDQKGKIIRASQLAYQLYGDNPLFRTFEDVFPLQFIQQPQEQQENKPKKRKNKNEISEHFSLAVIFEGNNVQGVEVIFQRKDRKKSNLLLSARSMLDANNHIQGCVVTLTDITSLKQTEAALRELNETLEHRVEERTAALIQSNTRLQEELIERQRAEQAVRESQVKLAEAQKIAHIGNWEFDVSTQKITWSEELFCIFGLDPTQPEPTFAEHIQQYHPEDREQYQQITAQAIANGKPYEFDLRILRRDGYVRWINKRGEAVVNALGQVKKLYGTAQDISDRKQAEKELELQAVISKIIPGGICLVRASDHAIVYSNLKFEQMFGYEVGELKGKNVSILNYEDKHTNATETTRKILEEIETHGEIAYEVHNVKKDGTPFWCRAMASKFEHPDYGKIYVAAQQDITQQKQAEEHIKASLKEKEVLLKEIHHRVKNNLQIVSSLLQMQSRRAKEEQASLVLQDSQNRIASIALVHEKLYRSENLAKINFSQYIPDLTIHLFDSYNVSSDTVTLDFKVDEIFLEIETAIPCGLIINELISNALKYAFPKHRKGKISIEFHANPEGTLTLIVRDNGIGIPAELNLETPTSLGLTLIQGLVEQLEGMLECDRHQGTEFRITFPEGSSSGDTNCQPT